MLQEALSAAWRKRGQFDPARGTARNWLLAIVADQCFKNRRRFRPVLLAEPAERPVSDTDGSEQVDIDAALAKLTDPQPRTGQHVTWSDYLPSTIGLVNGHPTRFMGLDRHTIVWQNGAYAYTLQEMPLNGTLDYELGPEQVLKLARGVR